MTKPPKFTIEEIKYSTDTASFKKALELYKQNKVKNFKSAISSYTATVEGTSAYKVTVESQSINYSTCTCYLGQNDTLCKHMIAVAIYAIYQGSPLPKDLSATYTAPTASTKKGEPIAKELDEIKAQISKGNKLIQSYNGPSSIWFTYQGKLREGCTILSQAVSKLPVSAKSADIIVKLLLKLDKKLTESGVDDSNGIVGGFIEDCVVLLLDYHQQVPECKSAFVQLEGLSTCFDWELKLINL